MANKTKQEPTSVDDHIAGRATPEQAADCAALVAMLRRVTGEGPVMWGPSIVGFGRYRYVYDSGRGGEAPVAGFAIRGRELVLYLMCEDSDPDQAALLAKLGKHRMGKACLYFRKLADLDAGVLEQLAVSSVAQVERQHARVPG